MKIPTRSNIRTMVKGLGHFGGGEIQYFYVSIKIIYVNAAVTMLPTIINPSC